MRKALWIIPLALVAVLLAAAGAWLLYTEAGLKWAYAQARSRLPGTLETGAIEGRLAGPIEIHDLRYHSATLDARIAHAVIDWAPLGLFAGRLTLEQLVVSGVDIETAASPEPRQREDGFSLPLAVEVEQAELRDIRVHQKDQQGYTVRAIDIAAHIDNDVLTIEHLRVEADEFFIEAQGALGINRGSEVLTVNWRVTRPSLPVIAGNGTLSGNLSAPSLSQQLTEPVVANIDGKIEDLRAAPKWRVTADVPEFSLQRLRPDGPAGRLGGTIAANGTAEHVEGNATMRGNIAELPAIAGALRFRAKAKSDVVLEDIVLTVPGTDARARPETRAGTQPTARGRRRCVGSSWRGRSPVSRH